LLYTLNYYDFDNSPTVTNLYSLVHCVSEYGGETLSAQGVISEHLLTFDDISVLQTRNAQLLKVVRKLSADQESGEAQRQLQKRVTVVQGQGQSAECAESGEPAAVAALQAAMKELSSLRDTRERTEEMVMSLVQQRDLYKAMLEEADITIAAKGSATPGPVMGSPQETTGSPMPISRYAMYPPLQGLQGT
jgi:hypothetical protein